MIDDQEFDPDPLNFNLKWVNGACYRVYEKKSGYSEQNMEQRKMKPYCEFDDDEQFQDDNFESCANPSDPLSSIEIKQTENGRFQTTIQVPQCFYAYIIGTKGSRKKQIESSTKTEIRIPRVKNDRNIIITGPTASNVISARQKIDLMATDLRGKHPITHFISFPLTADNIKSNFCNFKEEILKNLSIAGIDESVFISEHKLHLTIGTLTLLDEEEISTAAKIFEKMKTDVVDPFFLQTGPLKFHVRCLQYMNDDPGAVDVLYARVELLDHKSELLQELSDRIVDYFFKNGLMKKDFEKVKLHMTLMNTRYQRDKEIRDSKTNGRPKRVSFDARSILENLGNFDFGIQKFREIQLSDRSTVGNSGYYGCVYLIKL